MTRQVLPRRQAVIDGDPQAIEQLLLACFPVANGSQRKAISDAHFRTLLLRASTDEEPAAAVRRQLESIEALSPRQSAWCGFVDKLFGALGQVSKLHPDLLAVLQRLKHAALNCGLDGAAWCWREQHPLQTALASIEAGALGWQPELGRAAEKMKAQIEQWLETLRSEPTAALQSSIDDYFTREQQRIDKLAQRLADAEQGALRARRAQQASARLLNQKMAGKRVPPAVARFLHGPWRESLRLQMITHGIDSAPAQRIGKLTETLIASLQPIADDEQLQQRFQIVPQLRDELHELLVSLAHNSAQQEHELALIEREHLTLLKGGSVASEPCPLIDNSNPLVATRASVSKSLLQPVQALQEGQWLLHDSDGLQQRLMLARKLDDVEQLLFVNLLGVKVAQYSFDELAYQLSSRLTVPLQSRLSLRALATALLGKLYDHMDIQLQQLSHAEQEQREQQEREAAEREKARAKALAEAQALAAAQAEQRRLEEEQARQAEAQRREQLLQQRAPEAVRSETAKLSVGALVVFHDEFGVASQCKLAVRLQSSGKLIFVDKNGLKKIELLSDQLDARLAAGSAAIISRGEAFEDSLARVVNGLRKSPNGRSGGHSEQ